MPEVAERPAMIEVVSPVHGTVVGRVADTSPDEVQVYADRVRANQPDWAALPVTERSFWLNRFRDWLLDNERRLIEVVLGESGKVCQDAALEVPLAADMINYFNAKAPGALAIRRPRPHGIMGAATRLELTYRPYALVGVISPWNFPLALPMMDIVPALLAGAAVLVKPSEFTPLSMEELARGWHEIGAPEVFHSVSGGGVTGSAVVDSVDYLQFTGSSRTGRKVAVQAANRMIPCGLELGGKDPMVVLADADIERAVNGAIWGGLFNSGQTCVAVERILVAEPVHDEFVERLVRKVVTLRSGGGTNADIGAMANLAQLESVERHVADAVARGARVVTGGHRTGVGLHFEPTIIVDTDPSMLCMREETFGPLLPVMRVRDVDQAVQVANDCAYGLSASVWSHDVHRAKAVADLLEVGAVNVNGVLVNVFSFALPHGGWKGSGIGARSGGQQAIRKYTRPQARTSPRMRLDSELTWFPYSAARTRLISRVYRAAVAKGRRRIYRGQTPAQDG